MRQNKRKNKAMRWLAACLSAALCFFAMCPAAFADEEESETIHIRTLDDLREMAENCRLDTWSQGKTFVLEDDLVLDETAEEFLPIPSFGGTFEGGGHSISGFTLEGEDSRAGLFDTLQAEGLVNQLTVVGRVKPGGDSDTIGGIVGINYGTLNGCSFEGSVEGDVSVGGIVGINETSGQVVGCTFQGTVTGEHYVGGIAGQNTGSLILCVNNGEINTTAVEVQGDISDISLLRTTQSVPAGTDIGGIAGFSSGIIQSCENSGNVGYEHMGYNVGGIVGRQSGYMDGCKNTGTVNGRKDVGGIAGQLEPQVTLRYNEDLLDKLWTELDVLQGLTNQAAADAQAGSYDISLSLSYLISDIMNAKDAVSGLSGAMSGWSDDMVYYDDSGIFYPEDSEVTEGGAELDEALALVIESASWLQDSVYYSSEVLVGDFNAINNQVSVIVNLLQQQLQDTKEIDVSDAFEDVSDEDIGEPSAGKIYNTINSGEIFGDLNVAGIVGSMSVEYDFDPEDDLTKDGDRSLDFQYKTLAVVSGCTNRGSVSAKKDYAGGIVGRMDLGAVKACRSYGDITSSGGDYVGGIAGIARATVRNCYVKCSLSGMDYVGGVIGAGEENTVVSGCCTLVDIPESKRYYGAVSGTEEGDFSENYFVSDNLAGLGRISYTGKAEPISFETMSQISGLPEEMTSFTLRFMVEDEVIKSENFSYGDSFGDDVFPELPIKEGCYAAWDTEELSELHFDKTVRAEYERYVLTLPSQETRDSGRPIFLLDGDFDDEAVLTVSAVENTELIHGKEAAEQWLLQCSDTGLDSYTLRCLCPDDGTDSYSVFIRRDGVWEEAECSTFGTYLLLSLPSAEAELAFVASDSMWMIWLSVSLGVFVLLVILVILLSRGRKKNRKPASPKQPAADSKEQHADEEKKPAVKKRRKWWPVLAALVLVLLIAAGIFAAGKLGNAVSAYEVLQEFAERPEYAMSLSVYTQLDGQMAQGDVEIIKTQTDGQSVTCIRNEGISLYYADSTVFMENGKVYQLSSLYPDYSQLTLEAAKLFQNSSFTVSKNGDDVSCTLSVEGENARILLSLLIPEQIENLPDTQRLTVELDYGDDGMQSLSFSSQGTLADEDRSSYSVSAQLQPIELEEAFTLPEAVAEAIGSGETGSGTPISEDVFRLFSSWAELNLEESFTADIELAVECSPISISEEMKYEQTRVDGEKIGCIRREDIAVYFADGVFCSRNGVLLNDGDSELIDSAKLLDLLYQLCLNGEFSCADTGNDSWLYTLDLDKEAMEQVAYTVAPEMEALPVALSSGSIRITVKDGSAAELEFSCTGGLEALEEIAPVTVSVKLSFNHNSGSELPTAVRERLLQERGE